MDLYCLSGGMSSAAQRPAKLDFSWIYLQDQEKKQLGTPPMFPDLH